MLEKLFEAIDSKVLTDELKAELEASFNEAVGLKAVELSEKKVAELDKLSEEFKKELETQNEEAQKELLETVNDYLEKVVDDFVSEASDSLSESITQEKADLMLEAFDAMLVAGGVEVSKIHEAKIDDSLEAKLEEKTKKYDELMAESISKEKEINNLLKIGLINEMKEGLTIVESNRFEDLAELIEFSKSEEYKTKLEKLRESVKVSATKDDKEDLNENHPNTNTQEKSWKRFV